MKEELSINKNDLELEMGQDDDEWKLLEGTTLDDKYHLTSLVGIGGYGIVFLATGPIVGKKYAIKIMRNRSEELLESLA
jgi:serine/threonine protein kinase